MKLMKEEGRTELYNAPLFSALRPSAVISHPGTSVRNLPFLAPLGSGQDRPAANVIFLLSNSQERGATLREDSQLCTMYSKR